MPVPRLLTRGERVGESGQIARLIARRVRMGDVLGNHAESAAGMGCQAGRQVQQFKVLHHVRASPSVGVATPG